MSPLITMADTVHVKSHETLFIFVSAFISMHIFQYLLKEKSLVILDSENIISESLG